MLTLHDAFAKSGQLPVTSLTGKQFYVSDRAGRGYCRGEADFVAS